MSTQTLIKGQEEKELTEEEREIRNFVDSLGSGLSISLASTQGWIRQRTGKIVDLKIIAEVPNETPSLRKRIGGIVFIKE